MRRLEIQPAKATAVSLPVPLFNQKKRNRIPLTSAPSENEFFSHTEYMSSTSSASSDNASGALSTYDCQHTSGPPLSAPQGLQWNRQNNIQTIQPQQYGSHRPATTLRAFAPIPHPYKVGSTSTEMAQLNIPMRKQDSNSSISPRQTKYQDPFNCGSTQSKQPPHSGFSQMSQQSACRQANPQTHQYSQQSRLLPPPLPPPRAPTIPASQPQNSPWKFTNSFGPQGCPAVINRNNNRTQTVVQTQTQETKRMKSATENSLRILTAVIEGMRHWSQFKDKVSYLFEIFATLDSAVTVGPYGAKNFLMRDGKEVVQCVFYENEQELPRLIRGQVHRCVGNYDRSRNVLICVCVRPGQPSELRNAQETVKVCDAEMRSLLK
ncbi:spermatogenesis-associated protein 22 [Genypterus blacodes]|uniref:spermatogenesis-associated protein 22 n=1 Tax=Genypterus blacodes TaxID=154954 RepID=UPI003F761FDB